MSSTLPAAPEAARAAVAVPRIAPAPPAPRRGRSARDVFLTLLDASLADAAVRFEVGGESVVAGRPELEDDDTVVLRVHRERFFARVLGEGNLGMGESFMDGDFTVERGELWAFLAVLLRNRVDRKVRGDWRTAGAVLRVQGANLLRRHQWRQVQRHYDLGDDLFESFLDPTMTYSCGYVVAPEDTLEQMQFAKLDRICRKLELREGQRVLDIGCGFGGLLAHAAKHYGIEGVGITTSERHCARGNTNLAAAGLAGRVRLELRDHRTVEGPFDRVVSVGMMEHLPRREYPRYFDRIARALRPDGAGLVHVIGCTTDANEHDPFIQKYVFPGSGQVRLSEIAGECERTGLAIRDVENLCRHYGHTALHWLRNFRANQHRLDARRYDACFRRMWEYYLHCSVAGGFASDGALWQVLFNRDYAGHMPLQRV
jgi:cyclopropane-fatty-acyl-phospholipid synthase